MSRYVSPSSRFSAVAPPGPMLDSDAVGVTYWQVLRVRYLASGMWWVRWKSKKGFKKENGNLLRCQLQRRFLSQTVRGCTHLLWTLAKTWPFFSTWRLFSYEIAWENWISLNKIYSAEKWEETPPPRRSVSGWTSRTCVQSVTVYLPKTARIFRRLGGKHVYFA